MIVEPNYIQQILKVMFDLLKICNGDLKQFCFTNVELLSIVINSF